MSIPVEGEMRAWRVGFSLVLALAVVPHAGRADPPTGLSLRLRQIEGAFRDGSAASLRSALASSGKVRLDLDQLTPGPASYAPGQLHVIFSRLFEGRRTRTFSFHTRNVADPASGTAFARGTWTWQNPQGGQGVLTLTFVLSEEKGDWRVREIMTSR
jgi:hypothetical protein